MLYYCKTLDRWITIIEGDEAYQGTNLDSFGSPFVNLEVFNSKAETAQSELEQILANLKFNLTPVRISNAPYLEYAHAVIIWWHLELNTNREIVRLKYDDVLNTLKGMLSIVSGDGSVIYPIVPSEQSVNRSSIRVGYRNAYRINQPRGYS